MFEEDSLISTDEEDIDCVTYLYYLFCWCYIT